MCKCVCVFVNLLCNHLTDGPGCVSVCVCVCVCCESWREGMKNFSLTETEDKSQEDGNKEIVALFHVVCFHMQLNHIRKAGKYLLQLSQFPLG